MSARRLAVITRLVRVAFGKTKRASSPGMPAASRSPYSSTRAVDLGLVARPQVRVRLGDRAREHRRRALERDVALALLVEGDAGPVADELVRQRPADAADPEGEDDVLDRAAVAALDDAADQLLHLRRVDLAGLGAPEDLVRLELAVAGPAGRVDEGDVVALDDLAGRGRGASPSSPGRGGRGCAGCRSSRAARPRRGRGWRRASAARPSCREDSGPGGPTGGAGGGLGAAGGGTARRAVPGQAGTRFPAGPPLAPRPPSNQCQ